ncbi:MAG: hypothetical protein V1875_07890 [Candidatus Altiarchaeota archaeon]
MKRLLKVFLAIGVVLLFAAAYILIFGVVPLEVRQSFEDFTESGNLSILWSKSCTMDLSDTDNLVVMARLREKGSDAELACWWNRKPVGFRAGEGLVFNGSTVYMDQSWIGCGKDSNFTRNLREAIYGPGSVIYLDDRPARREYGTYYVLVSKCASGCCACGCSAGGQSNQTPSANATSAAYAVLDAKTKRIYW